MAGSSRWWEAALFPRCRPRHPVKGNGLFVARMAVVVVACGRMWSHQTGGVGPSSAFWRRSSWVPPPTAAASTDGAAAATPTATSSAHTASACSPTLTTGRGPSPSTSPPPHHHRTTVRRGGLASHDAAEAALRTFLLDDLRHRHISAFVTSQLAAGDLDRARGSPVPALLPRSPPRHGRPVRVPHRHRPAQDPGPRPALGRRPPERTRPLRTLHALRDRQQPVRHHHTQDPLQQELAGHILPSRRPPTPRPVKGPRPQQPESPLTGLVFCRSDGRPLRPSTSGAPETERALRHFTDPAVRPCTKNRPSRM